MAQQFGGNPPSLKWDQINNDTVRVIFPRTLSGTAQRVASLVQYINQHDRSSIGNQQRKVNMVLQNQTMISNGYVQLGPFRSEFYLAPPPNTDLGPAYWPDQLSVHEYRHVLQNMNFRQGISKVLYYLGGDLGQAGATNLAVPNWFWEGDAVTMETALGVQGRGRLPGFFDGMRALWLDHKNYTYMKVRNGSYVDFIPDHYPLGYMMSYYGRKHYGQTFWKDVTTDAVRFRGVFYPLSNSLEKRTGQRITGFYHATIKEFEQYWQDDSLRMPPSAATRFSPDSHTVTNYPYVYNAGPDTWVYLKNSYKKLPAFFRQTPDGQAHFIARPGTNFDDYFSYRNGRLVWTEARFDARWNNKQYSIVKIADSTGHTRNLTTRTKYFSPDISNDGKRVVVTVSPPNLQFSVQVLDGETGQVVQTLPNPQNWYYSYPKFTADDQAIIAGVRDVHSRMALIRQWLKDGRVDTLIAFGSNVIGIPTVTRDAVYFTSGYESVDNVYAYTFSDRKIHQYTARPNGVKQVAIDVRQDKLVFSEFRTGGFTLYTAPLAPYSPQAIDFSKDGRSAWLHPDFKEGGNILDKVPDTHVEEKKYPLLAHPFNFHSWVPTFNDPDYTYSLLGNNILNTTETNVGYAYNRDEGYSQVNAGFTFAGWFPYLQMSTAYTTNRNAYLRQGHIYWNEWTGLLGLAVPLNLSSGIYNRGLSISTNYNFVERTRMDKSRLQFVGSAKDIQYIFSSLTFVNQRNTAVQQLFTHFGQTLQVQYAHSATSTEAWQLFSRLDLYLPGFSNNHSILLQGAFQLRDTSRNYVYSDHFAYARGYNTPAYTKLYKLGANYYFPIAYPDCGFAQLLYIMRLRGNIFYDYSMGYENTYPRSHTRYASTGAELYFDTKLGNELPFAFGFRFSHLLDRDPQDNARNRFEVIIPLQQLFNY
ncbi:hypothetical protein DCM91_12715 [Chitinophaga costaii]|nr:hypothetical protein DCM91_12715 [Chitinophaga costaii]